MIMSQRMSRIARSWPKKGILRSRSAADELFDASDGVLVNAVIPGRESFYLARALDVGRLHIHRELAILDTEADVSVAFGQVPRELAERASTLIGTEVVLRRRESAHQLQRIVGFAIPRVEEPFQFVDGHVQSLL